jgi:hypothetical protein
VRHSESLHFWQILRGGCHPLQGSKTLLGRERPQVARLFRCGDFFRSLAMLTRLASRGLLCCILCCASSLAAAESRTDAKERYRQAAVRFAGGLATTDGCHRFVVLIQQRANAVAELMKEEVGSLPAEDFVPVKRVSLVAPAGQDGALRFPPNLTSRDPRSALSLRRASLQTAFDDVAAELMAGRVVPVEVRQRLDQELTLFSSRIERRDVASVIFCKRLREFARSTAAPTAHTWSEMTGGAGVAESFPGGTAGDLTRFVIDRRFAPATASKGSAILARIIEKACEHDRQAEEAARAKKETERNARAQRLANRRAAFDHAGGSSSFGGYGLSNASTYRTSYRYSTPYVYTYGTTPSVRTYRYVIRR